MLADNATGWKATEGTNSQDRSINVHDLKRIDTPPIASTR